MARIRYIKYQFSGPNAGVTAFAENRVGTRFIVEAETLPDGKENKETRRSQQAEFVKRVNAT